MDAAREVQERGRRPSRLQAVTLLLAVFAGVCGALAVTAWFPAGPLIVIGASRAATDRGGTAPRESDARSSPGAARGRYLVAGEAQLSVADNGWRPASLRLDAAFDTRAPRRIHITGPDGFAATQWTDGSAARLVISLDALAPRSRYTLEIDVADASGAPDSMRLGEPRVVADVATWQGLAVAWMGAVAGFLSWLALAGAASARVWHHAVRLPGWGLIAAAGLVPAAAVLPVVGLHHPTALVHAPLFGLSLLVLIVAGRVMRRVAMRIVVASPRASGASPRSDVLPEAADPATRVLVDLVIGVVGLAIALAWYSLVLKRIAGIEHAPLVAFPIVAAVALMATAAPRAAWRRHRREDNTSTRALLTPREAVMVAVLVFALCAIGGPHLATLNAYSSDPDQHVGWTAQVLAHGLLPDRYLGSGLHIDYPLGLHALAAVLSLFGVLPPGTAVAMLPVVASFVSIALFVLGAGRLVREPAAWTWREWLAASLGIAAMGVALSSSQFAMWQAYQGTGRLAAGLVQVVPVLVLIAAIAPGSAWNPARRAVAGDLFLSSIVVCLAGVVALWLNPGLVPLQVLLSGLALGATVIQARRLPWRRRLSTLAGGLAIGASLAVVTLAADPWVHRRLLRLGGRDVASAAALDRALAHHNADLTARSCLTWRCIAGSLSLARALDHGVRPWLVVALGPLDVARGRAAAPAEPEGAIHDGRASARARRFPDVTNRGYSPHHERADIAFALTVVALVPMLAWPRGRRVGLVLGALLVVASLDTVIAEHLHRLIDPGDAALKLLPPYVGRNGARLLTQAFWATAFGAVGFWVAGLAAGAGARWRPGFARMAGSAGLAAWALLAGWTTVDAGRAVWAGMTGLGLPFRQLRPEDLRDAAALVSAHVPDGETLLTPARHVYINGRHWLFPDVRPAYDLVGPLHLQARRASLFLYQFEHGARVSPFDYLDACREFEAGSLPRVVRETRARWALEVAGPVPLQTRSLCEHRMSALFPAMHVAAERGRVRLYELWD